MRLSRAHAVAVAAGLLALSPLATAAARAGAPNPQGGTAATACNDGYVSWNPTNLWPPNHKKATINITYVDNKYPATSGDADGDNITVTVGAITDNQIVNGTEEVGSGNPNLTDFGGTGNQGTATDPDNASTTAWVLAERSGTDANGRTYEIKVTCSDTGASSGSDSMEQGSMTQMQTVTICVTVPHDQAHPAAPDPNCSPTLG